MGIVVVMLFLLRSCLCHSRVLKNYTYTTPHEFLFKDKVDYCQLIRLYSTVCFSYTKYNRKLRTNVQAHTLAGIAVGWSNTANGLIVYIPLT